MHEVMDYNLIFAEHQRIETPRLILRPVVLADAGDMFAFAGDEETTRFVYPAYQTMQEMRSGIAKFFMREPFGKFGIELKDSGKMIGTIDLRVDAGKEVGEIGYVLNRNYWRKGYTSEAAEALLTLGFEKMELIRIFAFHDARNEASGALMKKIGMEEEGVFKQARRTKGEIVDDVYWGITAEAWRER